MYLEGSLIMKLSLFKDQLQPVYRIRTLYPRVAVSFLSFPAWCLSLGHIPNFLSIRFMYMYISYTGQNNLKIVVICSAINFYFVLGQVLLIQRPRDGNVIYLNRYLMI